MKKLLFITVGVMLLAGCCQDDDNQPTVTEPIIFSDLEVGQKFLYQRYVVNNCDSLPDSFEWRNDTLMLEVTGLEESRIFLQESLTEYSENYYENTPPAQYPLNITDDGLSLTEVSGSGLFSPFYDTLRLHSVNDNIVEQNGCDLLLDGSHLTDIAHILTFKLGDISQTDKSIIGALIGWQAGYLIYDNEKVFTALAISSNDTYPFISYGMGWNLIEE